MESWDRDLTVSCLFSATTDQRTLYLEWTHCVLPPIRESYREIDHVDDEGALRRTLRSAVLLPATAPGRLVRLCRRLVPTHRRLDEIDPDLYGAAESLRELAAETGLSEYFQRSDAELYIQVLEQAVFRGVTEFLAAKGYSVATVREVAHTTITSDDQRLRQRLPGREHRQRAQHPEQPRWMARRRRHDPSGGTSVTSGGRKITISGAISATPTSATSTTSRPTTTARQPGPARSTRCGRCSTNAATASSPSAGARRSRSHCATRSPRRAGSWRPTSRKSATVRVRWEAVLAILGTTLAMNADVAQITQFVMDLVG